MQTVALSPQWIYLCNRLTNFDKVWHDDVTWLFEPCQPMILSDFLPRDAMLAHYICYRRVYLCVRVRVCVCL